MIKPISLCNILLFLGVCVFAQTNSGIVKKGVPQFKDGVAQVIPEFSTPKEWIKEECWVQTDFDSDNNGKLDRMHVWVVRPYQTETKGLKLPVIYVTSPYFGGTGGNSKKYFWPIQHELGETPPAHPHPKVKQKKNKPLYLPFIYDRKWIPRGYIMVYSSSPGTGLSDGAPTMGGDNETQAPKAVIDWLCGRAQAYTSRKGKTENPASWSTGKVGMMGTSFNGTLSLAAASTGVEGLEAIIPCAPNTSYYHYYRSNGLIRSPGGYAGEDIDVLYDFVNSGDKKNRKSNDKAIRDGILMKGMDRVTGDYNDFWAERDYSLQLDSMKAAMFMCHGFNDWNVMPEHSFRVYKKALELGIPTQLYYHQNGHGGYPPMQLMNKWFSHYLHEQDNNVENDKKVWIVREGAGASNPIPYEAYPNLEARDVTLFPLGDKTQFGSLGLEGGEGIVEFTDDFNVGTREMMKNNNSSNRVMFATPALKKSVHLSGEPEITIRLSSSKPAANLSVWLVELPIDPEAKKLSKYVINRGWADPQNHSSMTESEPLVPGQFYDLTFKLMPDDQIISAGKQIGLMIFSSDPTFTISPEPGTVLKVDVGATKITLPVVGGDSAFTE